MPETKADSEQISLKEASQRRKKEKKKAIEWVKKQNQEEWGFSKRPSRTRQNLKSFKRKENQKKGDKLSLKKVSEEERKLESKPEKESENAENKSSKWIRL